MVSTFTFTEKWDVHTHTTLAPDTFAALARFAHYADFIRVRAHATKPCCAELVNHAGQVQRVITDNAYDGAARVRECNTHGITMQVLSPTPMMIPDYVDHAADAAEICRILNDGNLRLVDEFSTRFTALAALPMRDAKAAIKELERVKALGMRGVEINSNIHGNDLDDAAYYPIFEAAAALNMAVFIHPWSGIMSPTEEVLKRRMNKNWRAWLIGMGTETALAFDALRSGRVHERLPTLRVLYAHGGGAFPALLGRLEHGAYCRPDLFAEASPLDPYRTVRECGVYVDTLTHDAAVLELLIAQLGVERIAMGSDYPYPLGELDTIGRKKIYPGAMVEQHTTLGDEDKQRLLSGTAKEWLAWN
jgi:aminocarboxymuconate-semialdehyde decarboxylase